MYIRRSPFGIFYLNVGTINIAPLTGTFERDPSDEEAIAAFRVLPGPHFPGKGSSGYSRGLMKKERKEILKISYDLERKTLYCFRFGKLFGNAIYLVEKNPLLTKHLKKVVSFVLSTDFGYYLYSSLIKSPW